MFVINISAIIAVAIEIRAACGNEMIVVRVVRVVRDMGRTSPTSVTPGWSTTDGFNAWEEVSNPKEHQRAKCNKSISTSALVLSG